MNYTKKVEKRNNISTYIKERRKKSMPHINLDAVRVNAGMNQTEWASALGVTQNTVCNWEKGITEPSFTQVRAMSALSGIPIDFIFCQSNSK